MRQNPRTRVSEIFTSVCPLVKTTTLRDSQRSTVPSYVGYLHLSELRRKELATIRKSLLDWRRVCLIWFALHVIVKSRWIVEGQQVNVNSILERLNNILEGFKNASLWKVFKMHDNFGR